MRLTTAERRPSRPAFTLIELLVVMTIIAALIAMGVVAAFQMIGTQRLNNTEAALMKVRNVLKVQWNKVAKDARNESPSPAVVSLANGDQRRAQTIWVNLRIIEAFPQSYAEINNNAIYNYIPWSSQHNTATYRSALKGKSSSNNPVTESAACLLMALSINRGGAVLDSKGAEYADTDGDGLPEIIDGWGNPVQFFRFPTNNADIQANLQTLRPTFPDLLDPEGQLVSPNWPNANRNTLAQLRGAPVGVYSMPVIVSMGPDGLSGLDFNMGETGPQANDNVYSYRLKEAGGSGQ